MKYLNDISYKGCVGKIYKSKLSCDFKVLKYNNVRNVEIQFIKRAWTGFTWCEWHGEYDCEYPHIKVIDGAKF